MSISKPPKTLKDVNEKLLWELNNGLRPTRNLIEWLAVNPINFYQNLLNNSNKNAYQLDTFPQNLSKNALHQWIAYELYKKIIENHDFTFLNYIASHVSDIARSWAAFIVGYKYQNDLENLLENIKKFADDPHFWVRESAWMACRKTISQNLEKSIELLYNWVLDSHPNIRRFAIEVIRPRGVWCTHIEKLKEKPEQALPLLEALKYENHRYVQNSIGNWLNDASKSKPDFVIQLCEQWSKENHSSTNYIIRRALRTISKY